MYIRGQRPIKLCTKKVLTHLHVSHLLQSSQDLVVGALGLEARVEQQRVALGPPGVLVTNTPDSDTDTVGLGQAGLDDVAPVGSVGILDVDLGERTLGSGTAKSGHGGGSVGALAGLQVTLRANTIDGDTSGNPLLDVADHGGGLSVAGLVEASSCQPFVVRIAILRTYL